MRAVLLPSITPEDTTVGWPLTQKDLKRYPHFDGAFPLAELERIATDPSRVAAHPFFPFLLYNRSWQPFRKAGAHSDKKIRPIRYAARSDSAIFSYYRYLLSERYESEIRRRGIDSCPIAYRKISSRDGKHGKCNIDFAADAFQLIRSAGQCCAATLDISSYFECIDHARLRAIWCELLGVTSLPSDHAAVFKAITRYAVVERDASYERLGIIGPKITDDGQQSIGYLKSRDAMPIQLCSPKQFREKICGSDGSNPSLVVQNKKPFGIPQGAPISDLLANIYLLDFDKSMFDYAGAHHGHYFRYSDDIFIVVPGGEEAGRAAAKFATDEILKFGDQLKIKDKKTAIISFTATSSGTLIARRIDKSTSRGGLEYLGFRFDGANVYIRESTMSRFHRKVKFAARHRARALVRRYTGKDPTFLLERFRVREFEAKFGRVADFERSLGHRSWTFRTYVKRCIQIFGDSGGNFFNQMRNHRKFIAQTVRDEIEKAVAKRELSGSSLTGS